MRLAQRLFAGSVSLALLVGFVTSAKAAPSSGSKACQVSSFSTKPLWASAGFQNQSDLVVLDTVRRDLLPYSREGRAKRSVSAPLSKSLNDLYPIGVALRSDGLTGDGNILVQAEFNRFLVLTPTYTFESSIDVLARLTREGSSIERLYTWAPTWSSRGNENEIVAFADLKKDEHWSTGIVRFSADPRQESSSIVLKDLSVNEASRKFHRLGYSYISALQENAYVLLMDNGFRLWKSDKVGRFKELYKFGRSFPLKEVPVLPAFIRPTDYALVMSEVEGAEMPTGIYGWEGNLYVVWRRPLAIGGTEWLLSKVRPSDGQVMSTVVVPSRANHLFAVPGARDWVFVEKGPALGLRDQEVRSVLTVNSERLRDVVASAETKRGLAGPALKLCP
jgi:hypothetical protein